MPLIVCVCVDCLTHANMQTNKKNYSHLPFMIFSSWSSTALDFLNISLFDLCVYFAQWCCLSKCQCFWQYMLCELLFFVLCLNFKLGRCQTPMPNHYRWEKCVISSIFFSFSHFTAFYIATDFFCHFLFAFFLLVRGTLTRNTIHTHIHKFNICKYWILCYAWCGFFFSLLSVIRKLDLKKKKEERIGRKENGTLIPNVNDGIPL